MATTDTPDELDAVGAAMASAVIDDPSPAPSPIPTSVEGDAGGDANSSARRPRTVTKNMEAFETAEGVGARVKRSIGTPGLWNLSPFLILDHARLSCDDSKVAGFPDHAHRGMSTVSYVLEGSMQHEDFLGNKGFLGPGDVQWMTAGRGIVHSEMPYFDPERPVDAVALQLWIDLPARKKMVKPSYKEKKGAALAHATFPHGSVVIVSGESHGAVGPIRPLAGCWFLDYRMDMGADTWQEIPPGWTAFIYVLEGSVVVGDKTNVEAYHCAVLSDGDGVRLQKVEGKKQSRFVLIAGEPLDQPLVMQGPFVVTSKEAAVQALRDFQSGKNGFEKAPGWQSEIGKAIGMAGSRGKKGKKSRREDEDSGRTDDSPDKEERGKGRRKGRG